MMKRRVRIFSTLLFGLPLLVQTVQTVQAQDIAADRSEASLQPAVISTSTQTTAREQAATRSAVASIKVDKQQAQDSLSRAEESASEQQGLDNNWEASTSAYENDLAFTGTCEFSRASYTYSCN